MKINKLEIENVKRVRALTLEPSANGLTVIGGRNGQGKTSVLDAIAWALGGETLADVAARVEEPLRLGPPDGLWEKIRLLGKLKEWGSAAPKSVGRGACQEVVVQGDELAKRPVVHRELNCASAQYISLLRRSCAMSVSS